MKRAEYAIVIEKTPRNYGAYVPDLPGCAATGKTHEQVRSRLRKAIALHLQGLLADGLPIPVPTTQVERIALDSLSKPSTRKRRASSR